MDSQKKRAGIFSRLFRRKKELAEKEEAKEEKSEAGSIKAGSATDSEPEFLKEIDSGKSSEDAPQELWFWVCDGEVLKGIKDLSKALKSMSKETFKYHVNRYKNDFSTWIEEVIGDSELSKSTKKAKSAKEMLAIILRSTKDKMSAKTKKPEVKAQAAASRKGTKRQSTFDQLVPRIKIEKKKNKTLREWEKDLLARERALNDEEQRLNEKKIALSKKRIALLKEKSELERQKFERFMASKEEKLSLKSLPESDVSAEASELVQKGQKSINELNELVAQARASIEKNMTEEANSLLNRAKQLLKLVYMDDDERRRKEYEVLELEADAKLASLS